PGRPAPRSPHTASGRPSPPPSATSPLSPSVPSPSSPPPSPTAPPPSSGRHPAPWLPSPPACRSGRSPPSVRGTSRLLLVGAATTPHARYLTERLTDLKRSPWSAELLVY